MTLLRVLILLVLAVFSGGQTQAHALDPGYLEITPFGGDSYRVFFRLPDVQGQPMTIEGRLPDTCDPPTGPTPNIDGRAWAKTWVAACDGGLAGQMITIDGLEDTQTDVLVRVTLDGTPTVTARLTASQTSYVIPTDPGPWDVMASYFPLGVTHILEGIDHLLFVFALLLLIPDGWRLVGAITAFTAAHSLTMGAATLGVVTLPGPPVEAIIALSIMFVASELLKRREGQMLLSERYPWIVSFSFGLLHGFGFAGALQEIGLPQGDVPLALLAFNLGVEAGQLMFVAAILSIGWVAGQMVPRFVEGMRTPGRLPATCAAYLIGGISAYWFLERIAAFA